jgi:phage shock protein PspC (stress-responsive transcriptional regulator)
MEMGQHLFDDGSMADTGGHGTPPDPRSSEQPRPPEPPRLYREPEEKRIAGVCGGLGDYFGLDPTLVRLATVALALANGVGVLAYIVTALVVPERPPTVPRRRKERPARSGVEYPIVIAVVLVSAVLLLQGPWLWWNAWIAGALLIGIGMWMLISGKRSQSATTKSDEFATLADEPPVDWVAGPTQIGDRDTATGATESKVPATGPRSAQPLGDPASGVSDADDPVGIATPAAIRPGDVPPPTSPGGPGRSPEEGPPPDGPNDRDRGRILAYLLIAVGVLALLALTGAAHLSPARTIAAALVAVGALLVAGAWRGNARWLAWLGAPLLGVLVVVDAIEVPWSAGAGERVILVDDRIALTNDHELLVGELTIDLRDAPLDGPDVPWPQVATLDAALGAGDLTVILPDEASARVDARVRIGEIDPVASSRHEREGGINVHRELTLPANSERTRVRLDLRVGAGRVELRRGFDVPPAGPTATTTPPTTTPEPTTTTETTTPATATTTTTLATETTTTSPPIAPAKGHIRAQWTRGTR